jgi:hypothetical protein
MSTAEEFKSLKRIEDLLTVLVKVSLAETLQSIRADKQQQFLYENTGRVAVKEVVQTHEILGRQDFRNLARVGK